jgi:hypothetical protein
VIRVEPRLGTSMELLGAHGCNVHEEKSIGDGWRRAFMRVLLLLKDVDEDLPTVRRAGSPPVIVPRAQWSDPRQSLYACAGRR